MITARKPEKRRAAEERLDDVAQLGVPEDGEIARAGAHRSQDDVRVLAVGEILWEDAQGRCLATIAGRKPSVKDEVCDYCQEDIRGMTYSKAYHNVHPSCPSGKYCGSCYHEIMEDMDVFDW